MSVQRDVTDDATADTMVTTVFAADAVDATTAARMGSTALESPADDAMVARMTGMAWITHDAAPVTVTVPTLNDWNRSAVATDPLIAVMVR